MTVRPRVLVIDDIYGARLTDDTEQLRHLYCDALGLRDEADKPSESDDDRDVVDAVFCSGQTMHQPTINSIETVEAAFRKGWPAPDGRFWSAALVDMQFGDDDRFGLRIIDALHRLAPDVPIIVVSGQDQLEVRLGESLVDAAERLGAQEFLAAPGVAGTVPKQYLSTPANLRHRLTTVGLIPDPEQVVVGMSLSLCKALRAIRALTRKDGLGQVLLLGPAGSGKSHLRDYLHREVAARQGRPVSRVTLVPVFLSGVGEDMQKKSLVGTTDATDTKPGPGAFELARDGGLVFLDEIGYLNPSAQGDLLGPLQPIQVNGRWCRQVTRMGGTEPVDSRCFVAAATNMDLDELARNDRFSVALLQRFEKKRVELPSLSERRSDIPLLVQHFILEASRQYGLPEPPKLNVSTATWEDYAERHTVRDMSNLIETVVSSNRFKRSLTERDFFQGAAADGGVTEEHTQKEGETLRSGPSPAEPEVEALRSRLVAVEAELTVLRNRDTAPASISDVVSLFEKWTPPRDLETSEFEGAFQRLERAFGSMKLRLWRELLVRQKDLTGKATLMATVKRLLGREDIHKSRPGDLAHQVFSEAGISERPQDPILAEIWDKRRGSKK
jgi:DNA-binding NtrC family response regulator